jgi:hypothetical protein
MNGFKLNYTKTDISVLIFGLLVLFVPLMMIVFSVLRYTGGVFMYPLDDAFIHLEIAHHLSTEGVWGINNNEFGSASSSLLYTLILTVFRFFSESTLIPFIVNCIAGVLTVISVQRWLSKQGMNGLSQVFILSTALFLTPLLTMIMSGMEHTIQCLLSFLFIFHFSGWLEEYLADRKKKLPFSIILIGALLALVRYEGLFLIGIAGLLLLYYRNFRDAFILGFAALLPVILFGIYSLSKGSYFLPNSVLVKTDTPSSGIVSYLSNILLEKLTFAKLGMAALATQRWLFILPLLYLVFRKHMRPSYGFILLFLIGATVLQLALAATGWLYRYEAYLFFSSLIITCVLCIKHGRELLKEKQFFTRLVFAAVVFFLFFPILLRGATALVKTKQACINIYEQQYQMARFSQKYYFNEPISANDIGAVAYYTNSKIIDLWGLGTFEVAKSRKEKYWTASFLDSLSKKNQVKMAMAYDVWFNDSLKNHWQKVASWQIQNNVICGDDEVSFYAVDSSHIPLLKQQLAEFQSSLPSTISVKYFR